MINSELNNEINNELNNELIGLGFKTEKFKQVKKWGKFKMCKRRQKKSDNKKSGENLYLCLSSPWLNPGLHYVP